MKRNIAIIYATSALSWGRFFIPVLALFYVASEVSLGEFGIIMSVFALTTLLLEIPSGIIADMIGKKKSLIIARSCYVIEIIIIAFFNGFWPFLIAKIISGIGVSLSSGTKSGLLFDTLRRNYQEHKHQEIKGIETLITNISMAITFIIGAYLFTINPKLPAKVSLPFISLALLLTFFLKEPYKPNKHLALRNINNHLGESFAYFRRHKYVRYLIFYSMPLVASISVILSYSSIYYERILIPVATIGIVAFIVSMATALAAKRTYKIEKILGEITSLRLIPAALITTTLLLAILIPYVGIIFYIFIGFISGFSQVVLDNYMNKHIETSHRVTMLSIKNLFVSLAVFLLFPLFGTLMGLNIRIAYSVLAVIIGAYMVLFYLLFENKKF